MRFSPDYLPSLIPPRRGEPLSRNLGPGSVCSTTQEASEWIARS